MHTVHPIQPESITWMTAAKDQIVYFVRTLGEEEPSLVIKGEATGRLPDPESISWSSKLMKNVTDPRVDTKILTPAEIMEFKRAARVIFPADSLYIARLEGPWTWVKMPFVAGLTDAKFLDKDEQTAFSFTKLLKNLSNRIAWVELGKVVAVDMFNGNYDRITPEGDWQNRGNLMFAPNTPEPNVIGLDTFDTSSSDRSLTSAVVNRPALDLLRRPNHLFSVAVTASISKQLSRHMVKFGETPISIREKGMNPGVTIKPSPPPPRGRADETENAFRDYAPFFEIGMAEGADTLKNYLQRKRILYEMATPPKTMPVGIVARMKYLNWW